VREQKILVQLSEQTARYVLDLLEVDDYASSPNDYEAARLRYSIQVQLLRAQRRRAEIQ
jgi:hypothetical protein